MRDIAHKAIVLKLNKRWKPVGVELVSKTICDLMTGVVEAIDIVYALNEDVALARQQIAGLDEEALIDRGASILRQSVAERLIADVPVGAFLSGGLDSSLIVALIRQLRTI